MLPASRRQPNAGRRGALRRGHVPRRLAPRGRHDRHRTCETLASDPGRADQTGSAGGCEKNWDPAGRSIPKTTRSGVSRLGGQAGPRLRPYAPFTSGSGKPRRKHYPHSSCRIGMPARRAGIRRVVRAGLRAFGERVLAGLSGDVLEIGGGTRDGPALLRPGDHIADAYRAAASDAASPRARGREHCPSAKVLRAPAGDLPFDDHTFDMAVSTLVPCGVDDQPRPWRGVAAGAAPRRPAPVHRACMRACCPARRGEVMAACSTGGGRAG
jgi:hypothetical protein